MLMKTADFISSIVTGERTNSGWCSSVYFDGEHLFSYGAHYPLPTNVAGKWILNDSGYSNTTARHISWARDFADYVAASNSTEPKQICFDVLEEMKQKFSELQNLTNRAIKKREKLNQRLYELGKTKDFLLDYVIEQEGSEEDNEEIPCGNCGRIATVSIGEDMNRCDRCADLEGGQS